MIRKKKPKTITVRITPKKFGKQILADDLVELLKLFAEGFEKNAVQFRDAAAFINDLNQEGKVTLEEVAITLGLFKATLYTFEELGSCIRSLLGAAESPTEDYVS